jgi:3-oxoacyl-[acyl-carrier protein] reductase
VYVVTGGTSGLGRAAAEALVADGARVVVSSRDANRVRDTVEALGGPEHATGVAMDNADPTATGQLVAAARSAYGGLHGACISVGGPPAGNTLDMTDDQWRGAFESVFLGAVRIARGIAPELPDGGAIAFVLSSSVRQPIPGLAVSNGLRPGLAMVAKTLADELGPSGVRVVSLLPGRVTTARTLELTPDEADRAAIAATIPLRRYAEPEEFGRVAAFVLSPAASYLTGCAIPVDGGAIRSL